MTRIQTLGKRELGQGIVEFALAFTVLVAILIGLFEFGRMIYVYTSLYTASREAVRYGITTGTTEDGTPHYLDCDGIRDIAISFGSAGGVSAGDVAITYDQTPDLGNPADGTATDDDYIGSCGSVTADDVDSQDRVIVQVNGQFTPAGFIPLFEMPTLTITSVTRRTFVEEVSID